jgi:phage-related protein
MSDGSVTIEINGDSKGLEKEINGIGSKVKSGFRKIGSIAVAGLAGVTAAVGGAASALAGLGTASVNSYADLEQNIGGIETLFKGSADKVIKNAENAYKTAGMSANQYMETVTGFSASLLQSVGGDTEKAADSANMALIDMADNANKMGTSMESIQWAYQGFAKQNYTMLDNLKLGYGGTQAEMQRLLSDAEKITGIKYDISNLNDVFQAIHVIQGELGITGTTAQEAASTISGSIGSMKSAFDNFLNGSGTMDQLVDTGITAIQNIVNAVGQLLPQLMQSLSDATPQIIAGINQIFPKILDLIMTNAPTLISTIGQVLMALVQSLLPYMPQLLNIAMQLIQSFITGLITMLPQIIQMGMQLITQLILGIAQMLPLLIPQAINAIITIVNGLLDNIDMLIDAAIQLILGLADGLINALPLLIEKAPEIIMKLVTALIQNLPKILQVGVQLIGKLIEGVGSVLGKLGQMAGTIIQTIWDGLKSLPSKMLEVGKNLIQGIWNGISNAVGWLWDKISGFCSGIVDKIKGFFGIHSPSKVFADEVGKFLALGLGEGFDDNIGKVYKNMQSAVDFETQKLSANLSTTATNNKLFTANILMKPSDIYLDSTKVGRAVTPAVTKTLRGAGAY